MAHNMGNPRNHVGAGVLPVRCVAYFKKGGFRFETPTHFLTRTPTKKCNLVAIRLSSAFLKPKCEKIQKNTKISNFGTDFQQIPKLPFQGDHSKFEFLECCLKNADIPRGGGGLGILHTLATEKFEFRVIALERDFFEIFWNLVKTSNLWIFGIFDHAKNHENPTSSASIKPLWPCNHAHLVDLEKSFKMMVSRPPYDQIRP